MNKKKSKLDLIVDLLNNHIAKLLGKSNDIKINKKNIKHNNSQSDSMYFLIIVACCIFIWLTSGIYYVTANSFALIFRDAQIVKVLQGVKIGFAIPYPFEEVKIIDTNDSILQNLNNQLISNQDYNSLTSDNQVIAVNAKFSYTMTKPEHVFNNLLLNTEYITNFIRLYLQQEVFYELIMHTSDEILNTNLAILENNLKNRMNNKLANYGLKVVKLNINKVYLIKQKEMSLSQGSTPINLKIESFAAFREVDREVNRNREIRK